MMKRGNKTAYSVLGWTGYSVGEMWIRHTGMAAVQKGSSWQNNTLKIYTREDLQEEVKGQHITHMVLVVDGVIPAVYTIAPRLTHLRLEIKTLNVNSCFNS